MKTDADYRWSDKVNLLLDFNIMIKIQKSSFQEPNSIELRLKASIGIAHLSFLIKNPELPFTGDIVKKAGCFLNHLW